MVTMSSPTDSSPSNSFSDFNREEQSRLSDEVRQLKRTNSDLGARNAKLAEMLKSSRDKLSVLFSQLEDMAQPPSVYGTFLETAKDGSNAEIFAGGRRMRVAVSPMLCAADLMPGVQVRLGEGNQVLEACDFEQTGELATLMEMIGRDRALVSDRSGEERVVKLAGPLMDRTAKLPRPGDTLLVDRKAGYAFEAIAKTEISRLALEEAPDVSYQDIGGLDDQIELIQDAVELPFLHPEMYRAYNLHPPKGVLLYGPPGCGKTLIAKAVANSLANRIGETGTSYFINVKGPELLNKYVGETERQIRVIFERARELAGDGRPVIIFFDEMESIFRTRGSGVSSDMETTVVPQLLAELDGVEDLSNVIVVGATNREELIDPAILRPGRLDIKIRINRPNKQGAHDIFTRYINDSIPLAEPAEDLIDRAVDHLYTPRPYVRLTLIDGSVETLNYHDFVSGAMIANIVDRAKKSAIKAHIDGTGVGLTAEQLIQAIDDENQQSEDLPNTSNPDEWSRITGRQGKQVTHAEVVI
ncbi:ATPase, AAA+-class, putative proteasome subunit [Corynebacterium glutamicum MB001]|uniref:AAA ATPase forming ring-shaped complexes n=3 Tax=Corynebacterium TaxID=1716 RepID=ARC_CORGL|nr:MULTISPECIES: proteasome ATPase [Corynebacterium]A4QE83.1 RecName: Full=AAA ATPase forming ring-shaped complexes; Short=ARC [Corynebacterium glutamicum R]Q8NQD8.1 RecName: Full=AAA ATPase forming ring-shaped complexes; Short=ARC [Corynebacterium glutamicum ATCC 13032]AGT05462.1 ATPase, AAA+-class, putative proteasome subunit [Corynebacterium glutamicum MB001]ASW14112.1 ATPase, AAA+-class, putative proteasome subunit [Corynebacterium glutamicum]MBA4569932.1 proteasome ATPase [Corynebacterium